MYIPTYSTALHLVVWCVWCGVVWCVWCGVCGVVCVVWWCDVVWCGVVWCDVVWCAPPEHCSAPTQKVPGIEWIFSDHYTVCSRRDSNSRKVACMHIRQEWEEQEFDVCEGTTHVTLSHSVLVSI